MSESTPPGESSPSGERSSGERLARAARAAHDLSDALWESLHEALGAADVVEGARDVVGPSHAERVRELAQRLADVSSTIGLLSTAPAPTPPTETPLEPPEPSPDAGIEIHDTRGEEGPAAWISSIGRRLERYRDDRLPFAVLLVEIVDIERLVQAESPAELARLTDHVERAIGAELRPADLLTREALGRYWLVTPETDTLGARNLAERLARTVRLAARHRGVPLELAIGIAVCPDDGRDAAALAAHADVGVYAARAAGRPVAPADDPAA